MADTDSHVAGAPIAGPPVAGPPGSGPRVTGTAVTDPPVRGPLAAAWRRFAANRAALVGLVVFVLLVLAAFVGRRLWRWDYRDLTGAYSEPPSLQHPFGTNESGYDMLARVLKGTARSIEIALFVAVVSTALGTVIGAVAGYTRGLTDGFLMRVVDLVLILPLYAIAALLGHQVSGKSGGWFGLAVVLSLLLWAPIARVVRGVTLGLREQEFLDAARALGATDRQILLRHVLPNASGTIIVNATVCVAIAVLAETALSYVGFGIQAPDVSLGLLVANAEAASSTRSWLFYYPGLVLIVLVLTVNLIGDGLSDAFDPRSAR
ncbi:MAG: glutathione transport system permease protein [Frankiaceae bacterium]|nr:glutathione transport system permease protein [Frankiaceae bacterium]